MGTFEIAEPPRLIAAVFLLQFGDAQQVVIDLGHACDDWVSFG